MTHRDLTLGSIPGHIVAMSVPVMAFLVVQALNFLVDLYFVTSLGSAAVAAVSVGTNAILLSTSLVQVLSVGTASLMSQAVGTSNRASANIIFNQAILISAVCATAFVVAGYACVQPYVASLTNEADIAIAGVEYLSWLIPALTLQFAMVVASSALRSVGIVRPTMVVYALSVVFHSLLAPVLILVMGVAGAGLAGILGNTLAVTLLWTYFQRSNSYVTFDFRLMRPKLAYCKRILGVGLPAGGELILTFVYTAVAYWAISGFGAASQAAFGLGSRLTQLLLVPVVGISFAITPIIGQNLGAGRFERIEQTYRIAALWTTALMLFATVLLQMSSTGLMRLLSEDPTVIAVGAEFLRLTSWVFVGRAFIHTCSSTFQGLGHTTPPLISAAASLAAFTLPIWIWMHPGGRIEHVWYFWNAALALQAGMSLVWLRAEFSNVTQRSPRSVSKFLVHARDIPFAPQAPNSAPLPRTAVWISPREHRILQRNRMRRARVGLLLLLIPMIGSAVYLLSHWSPDGRSSPAPQDLERQPKSEEPSDSGS